MNGELSWIRSLFADGGFEQDFCKRGAFAIGNHPTNNVSAIDVDDGVEVVSRPRELHPQPLSERCVNLSAHTAPIKQTRLSHLAANVRIDQTAFPRFFRGKAKPVSYAL